MKAVNALAINSREDIFAGTGGNVITDTINEVFLSTDNGHSWREVGSGLPNNLPKEAITSLAINSSGYIFAGIDSVVFRSVQSTTSMR